jgi:hypothetical protein
MAGFLYNRTKKCFSVIKKRDKPTATSESYGLAECCEPMLVLAHASSSETWKNDITSAWESLDFATDDVTFKLYNENDELIANQPNIFAFNTNALNFYTTINWQTILNTEGTGCYRLMVELTLSGTTTSYEWGHYNLQPYTADNAKNSIRIRSIFNQYHKIEDIDFTGENVEDTIRIHGYFGSRQPNTVVDNLIYQSRIEKNVQRENLNTYELITDPIRTWYIDKLIDLHLLSECEIFLSDHNPFNLTYIYKDTPLIVKESPEIEYKEFSRLASVKCIFSDKIKDKLSKYNG